MDSPLGVLRNKVVLQHVHGCRVKARHDKGMVTGCRVRARHVKRVVTGCRVKARRDEGDGDWMPCEGAA